MPDVITADEYLVINSVPLATPAWRVTSLVPLFSGPTLRGDDVLIPGVDGVIPMRRRVGVQVLTFPMVVFGTHDREGAVIADARAGLTSNIDELLTAFAPVSTGDGTVPAVWHRGDGSTAEADVHVVGMSPSEFSPQVVRFQLGISIPAGRFV